MADRKTLRQSAGEELAYAASDIRGAWERAWFGRETTPAQWQDQLSRTPGSDPLGRTQGPDDSQGPGNVHGHNPDAPEALDGIGRTGDGFDPDHTRDAVRSFYGTDPEPDYRQACADMFAPDPDEPDAPEMTQRMKR
ncbi:hypothetical protein RDV64_23465 (plasmid) [Acuticoccus sp. MNP-M23]|uniref:hypothetical protein n=1 Tax=Acuticoccus sp. MNP-M23 TaxID=3072793 RepID=UPI0028159882|nr:hypothetical protein [Acuticoccus sp. MNP-M23]WMS45335.1 hypothetical protein RDV64_23465 [Acuticoccus sp. MNP-M23]